MDQHALNVLEFERLLEDLAGRTQSGPGRARVKALGPCTSLRAIRSRRAPFLDAMRMLQDLGSFPEISFPDVSDILRRVGPTDAVLAGEDLVLCRAQLDSTGRTAERLEAEAAAPYRQLTEIARRLEPCHDLCRRLHRSLDRDGGVLDDASPALGEIRRRALQLERRIQRSLDGMLQNTDYENVLQERFVTVRNGRFVVPIKREEKNRLPGVVHDHSNSGRTVFIEPTSTLPLGNDLAAARLEERDEILRILAALSDEVRQNRRAFSDNHETLADLDAAFAVARWARDYGAVCPRFGDRLRVVRGRHPLLLKLFREEGREKDLVPLDLSLPPETHTLVVTGSNTGGKTVALKTVGLLTLAAQTALPVPAGEDSEMVLFDNVFADIGDEQSLEHSLSTFSAHMTHITRIMCAAGEGGRSLVLLDELGSGTDPVEGGALACAVLLELGHPQTLTLATSHLGFVKNFVHEQAGMANAAVRFDTTTLKPEYALDIGRPGASHALLIAQRLEVPDSVLSHARRMLSSDHLKLESVLARMEEDQRRLSTEEREVAGARREAVERRDELQQELKRLRKERKRLMHDAYRQAEGIVENARRQMERQLAQMARDGRDERERKAAARRAREAIEAKKRAVARAAAETAPRPRDPMPADRVEEGIRVWVPKLKAHGMVHSRSGSRAEVDVNGMRVMLPIRQLEEPRDGGAQPAEEAPTVRVTRPQPARHLSHEIVLIGLRVDEAVERLDQFIDRAILADMTELRVVHGYGTDRLRRGLHAWLREHRRVARFRIGRAPDDPGGGGVTLVELR